jgi:RNA polymerase sigma-70 factor (ECF subfamily)
LYDSVPQQEYRREISLLETEQSIDDEYLARYQNGDFTGFDRFYQKNHALIFQFLLHRLHNRADAEEAFQETFLRIHRFITTYDKRQKALAWVFTIARNVAIDFHKHRQPHAPINDADAVAVPRVQDALEAREELTAMLAKLSEPERELLENRLLNDDGFEEIASQIGTTPTNVRQKFSRILRKLRAGG